MKKKPKNTTEIRECSGQRGRKREKGHKRLRPGVPERGLGVYLTVLLKPLLKEMLLELKDYSDWTSSDLVTFMRSARLAPPVPVTPLLPP